MYKIFKEDLMKKIYLGFWLFFVSGVLVSAQSTGRNGHSLTLGTSIGLLAGEGEEIVYRYDDSDDKLSQLLWPFKPLFYAGVDLHYNWQIPASRWNIFVDGIFKFGFPGETGQMEDRDWADARYADFLTHYSIHDNKTENAMLIDANIGASFTIFEKYMIKTFITYSYMNFSWTASRGSFLYPDSDGGHGYMVVSSDVGTYKQAWNIISPGVSFYGEFNQYFDIELSFKLSPFIWLSAKDEHLVRKLVITDDVYGGFFIEPGLLFSFKPNNFITLSFSFLYRNISGTRGDGEYKQQGQPTLTVENLRGAGYSAFDIGIMTKFNILK
jgi:outer membrane protease